MRWTESSVTSSTLRDAGPRQDGRQESSDGEAGASASHARPCVGCRAALRVTHPCVACAVAFCADLSLGAGGVFRAQVVTSHDQLGDTGKPTGFWLEEFAAPYFIFKDAGCAVTIASPKGGQPPCDPGSRGEAFLTEATKRFDADAEATKQLAESVKLESVSASDFDAIFYPGGHGPLWDLVDNAKSISLIEAFWAGGKPVGAVCHGPAVLKNCKAPDGKLIIEGKNMTAFTNSEEAAVGLTEVVPFALESFFGEKAKFDKAADWNSKSVVDGKLVTGQNPQSSEAAAKDLLALLA